MELNAYQAFTRTTAHVYADAIRELTDDPKVQDVLRIAYAALGLGEAGEIQGKVKKLIRDAKGDITYEILRAIAEELGDLLWYVAAEAAELGYTLDEIAEINIEKLTSRKKRGVIGGSGDNR